jgi:hypothetical protein
VRLPSDADGLYAGTIAEERMDYEGGRRGWRVSRTSVLLALLALTACSNRLSLEECQKDADCASANNIVISANQTASNICPRRSAETNPPVKALLPC